MAECCGKPCNFWRAIPGGSTGHCRVKPPTVNGAAVVWSLRTNAKDMADAQRIGTMFPVTDEQDWCGAYEPDGGHRGPC